MSKKMKIAIATVCIVAVIGIAFFLLSDRFVDDGLPTIFISEGVAEIGGEVSVNVSVRNNPGLSGFILELEYDEQMLMPIELTRGSIVQQGLFDSNLTVKERGDALRVVWFDISDIHADGDLYSIRFRVVGNETGRTPIVIRYEYGDIANQYLESVDFNIRTADVRIRR